MTKEEISALAVRLASDVVDSIVGHFRCTPLSASAFELEIATRKAIAGSLLTVEGTATVETDLREALRRAVALLNSLDNFVEETHYQKELAAVTAFLK